MDEQRTYRRTSETAPRPPEWDRPVTRFWLEALLGVLAVGLAYAAVTMPGSGSLLGTIGVFLLPLSALLGLAALVGPRARRRPGTLVAARSPGGFLRLEADPSVARLAFAAFLAAGLTGPFLAVDVLLQGANPVLPPPWLTMPMFVATLVGLPMAWELGRGRLRAAEMTLMPETFAVDAVMTTRTVMWSRIRSIEPVPGRGARVTVSSSAPIDRKRRGSTGRGRATTVVEDPQLTETFSLAAYPGDPAVLLSILHALADSPDAATRLLAESDPAGTAVDL
ncbi:hypothetical protein ACPYO6_01380 [Georgenia sp. Z1344]|uniref:hypothetical protein n=1 Tax=Georgenia sp. Z1344 TaxID=3416706 RepID=UPI003CE7DF9C